MGASISTAADAIQDSMMLRHPPKARQAKAYFPLSQAEQSRTRRVKLTFDARTLSHALWICKESANSVTEGLDFTHKT